MNSVTFPEANAKFTKPSEWPEDRECFDAAAWKGNAADGNPVIVTCWEASPEELAEINRTGRVWLIVAGEDMMPCEVRGTSAFIPSKPG